MVHTSVCIPFVHNDVSALSWTIIMVFGHNTCGIVVKVKFFNLTMLISSVESTMVVLNEEFLTH